MLSRLIKSYENKKKWLVVVNLNFNKLFVMLIDNYEQNSINTMMSINKMFFYN